ncbi:Gfo/Idh/MocA family oxidoreductase [Lederbergia sp. NSJ-179]|uniref:Gfo/Idh/MocA family protein n=1 Tax=Lederbergia sp. NSJ-179 TaxID=2931402 RepID=UPI001FD53B0B|nr:Gfo/Idh/MocA family oxidoreductase [Lederbergia sp. NSJ-179]MCJ7841497.1 Gfo/Idh/MocA family oxidoreductase [Lederbergia sp. NSJ-179]
MTKLKVGVVGCGSIARFRHLPEYAMNEHVEIVAVCDIVKERANEMADKFGGQAFTSYEEMLREAELDIVSVCTPNYLHAPISIAALKAGNHVLCEKPMATSEKEALAMIQAAEAGGKKLMIAHNQRFVASHEKARELIANGEVGRIHSFRTAFGHPGPEGWSIDGKDSWFFRKEEAFIGAMGDLGVHKTDLMRFLLGEEFVEVGSFVESGAKENSTVDDNAVCILKSESGIIGTLAASWAYGKEDNATIIYGEKAVLRLEDDPDHSLIVHHRDGKTENFDLGKIQSNEDGGQTSTKVIDHFVDSIVQDTEPPVTGVEGMRSLKVVIAALESSIHKKIVKITQ